MARKTAFSLIELLVVIGIIAILLAILLPVISSARAAASDTQCRARLRGLYVAEMLYAQANKDRMTPAVFVDQESPFASGAMSWHEALGDTLRVKEGERVFDCPLRPADDQSTILGLPQSITYGINTSIMMPQWGLRTSHHTDGTERQPDPLDPAKEAAVQPFSQLILFADKGASSDDVLRSSEGLLYLVQTNYNGFSGMWEHWIFHSPAGALRHGSKARRVANAVFMDGHVGPVRDEMSSSSGHWYFGREPDAIRPIGLPCCP